MFDKIIVAIDTADHYAHIFNKALSLAQATGAELKILSVLTSRYGYGASLQYSPGLMDYPMTMEDSYLDNYRKEYMGRKEECFRILSDLSDRARNKGVNTEFFQKSGEPGVAICELASTEKADLVIVGSHGRRGLGEFLVGSVSSYVMHRACCSVMVIHEDPQSKKRANKADKAAAV